MKPLKEEDKVERDERRESIRELIVVGGGRKIIVRVPGTYRVACKTTCST